MKYGITLGAAAALALFVSGGAWATTVNDTSLASPGVYYGTGNSGTNGHFSVTTSGGIEIGQDAITRFVGAITPTGNVYDAPTGSTAVPGHTGADWGVVYSINTHPGGVGTLTLGDLVASWTLHDVVNGTTDGFSPFLIPDNAEYGPSGTFAGSNGCAATGAHCGPGEFGVQNSEALSFSGVATAFGDPSFNVEANDTYDFTLTVSDVGGNQLATNTIEVCTGTCAPARVPEPSSLPLAGFGIIGSIGVAGLARRRRRSTRTFMLAA